MEASTHLLWTTQDRHVGDRLRLFTAVAGHLDASDVLYPGSFVDIAPSFVFDRVTYVDTDRRARRFFDDDAGVQAIVAEHRSDGVTPSTTFIHSDYRDDLGLADGSFDLLVSLYAGFVSEHCTAALRSGGSLLVNPSHGDAAMASIDDRYELTAVVKHRSGRYRVDTARLDRFLIPKREQEVTVERLHESGRGIAYTVSPFAYLFTRVR